MGESGQGGRRRRVPSSCRAWAGGLDDESVEELRRRVGEDALAAVALLYAHAPEWEDQPEPAPSADVGR